MRGNLLLPYLKSKPLFRSKITIICLACMVTASQAKEIELLKSFRVENAGLEIVVRTGGCTQKEDFRVEADVTENLLNVSIIRLIEGNCKGFFPRGLRLNFQWDEVIGYQQGMPIKVLNPVISTSR